MNYNYKLFLSSLFVLFVFIINAQISEGGTPYTFNNPILKTDINTVDIAKPSQAVINQVNNGKGSYKIGHLTSVNLNMQNSGNWQNLPNGGKLWRLKIHSDDALALAIHYSSVFIPNGAELFLYNEYRNQIVGKFTSSRNFTNSLTHTQMIQGANTYLEYYQAPGITQIPIIQISKVAYVFRGVEDFINQIIDDATGNNSNILKADNCQIDVACSPENNGWGEQIDAAVHYTMVSGGLMSVCSASLLNNTAQDCTPYILSAWHCGEESAGSTLSGYTWYWNYQKSSCSTGSANSNNPSKGTQTMINGTVRASSGSGTLNNPPGNMQVAGSDFYLVQLASSIPSSYNAFYAGWNKGTSAASNGVSVHHPSGSAKKISTFTSSLSSSTYNGGANNAHWRVYWSSTANGHGVTEGGSSGSPIFDQNGRVVGQLSGGGSYCTTPGYPDSYGKFSKNWDANGNTSSSQLKPWLDPNNSGANTLDGAYEPCNQSVAPTCAINTSTTTIIAGSSVTFSDASTGSPNSWSWNFDNTSLGGVSPSTSSIQNPGQVVYSNAGTYQVMLTASNSNGTCSTTVNITVNSSGGGATGCDTLINIAASDTITIYTTNNGGYLAGWNGYGDISKCEKFSNYLPYNILSEMNIYFYGVNDGGNGATVDFNIWDDASGQPGSIIGTTQISLASLDATLSASGGMGIVNVTFPTPITLSGNPFYCGITMNGFAAYPGGSDSLGIVTNTQFGSTPNSGWEQWSGGGGWYEYSSASAWGIPISQYITPIICGGGGCALIVNISTSDATCNNQNGQINISASGGTSPYTYSIDGGVTSQNSGGFTSLAPGTYNVLITDANNCTDAQTIIINNTPPPTVLASGTPSSVTLGSAVSFSSSGSNASSYLWDFGDGSSSTQSNPAHTYNAIGTYTVTLTGTVGACTNSTTITIVVVGSGVGILDYSLSEALSIKPNPNNGTFELSVKLPFYEDYEISLYNALGELINNKKIYNAYDLKLHYDLTNNANGFYYISVKTNTDYITRRLIINR